MSLLSSLFGKVGGAHGARDISDDISDDTKALLEEFIAENLQRARSYDPLIYSGAGKKLLALPDGERLQLVIYLMSDAPAIQMQSGMGKDQNLYGTTQLVYTDLPARLLRKKTDASVESLLRMLDIVKAHANGNVYALPVAGILRIPERMAEALPCRLNQS